MPSSQPGQPEGAACCKEQRLERGEQERVARLAAAERWCLVVRTMPSARAVGSQVTLGSPDSPTSARHILPPALAIFSRLRRSSSQPPRRCWRSRGLS